MNSRGFLCDGGADDMRIMLRDCAAQIGFAKIGFARADEVDARASAVYRKWIADGRHASMAYMERYADVRSDPRLLLDGACTVVSCAVPYPVPPPQAAGTLKVASYALGKDYHTVVRAMLFRLAEVITRQCGGDVRVCVDTAPIRERYWAARAGLGFIGLNNQLIIPGYGSRFFLGEIVCTAEIPANSPCTLGCGDCMACVKACPGHALDGAGGIDCSRCLSYLTIEHRGELPEDTRLRERIYGCDVCQDVCPHNRRAGVGATVPDDLQPRVELLGLTPEKVVAMTPGDFRRLSRHSAIRRITLGQLLRNLGAAEV